MENEKSIKTFFKRLYRKLVTQPVEDRTYTLSDGTKVIAPFSNTPMIFAILFVISVVSWTVTNVDIHRFISNLDQFFVILRLMIKQFDFSYSKEVFKPLIATVQMSILGSFLGALLALPIALLASSNINKNRYVLVSVRFILSIIRTFPVLVYAYFLAFIFYYGTLPGTLAIIIFTFAIMSKMLYEKIETIDMGAFIAIEATGATKAKAFFSAVIPQIMGTYLSLSLYSFEINIRYAAILGYVGAGGIGVILDNRMTLGIRGGYGDALVILIYLFLTVVSIESLSRYLRKRLL
jgi:phosphonate transport system permease protein